MSSGRTSGISPNVWEGYYNPEFLVQEGNSLYKNDFISLYSKIRYSSPDCLREMRSLFENSTFLNLISRFSRVTSFEAADCTLTTPAHAAFAEKLPKLAVVTLTRGTITNVALNALFSNWADLKAISFRGEEAGGEHKLYEKPKRLEALQGKHFELFDLQGYSSTSGILKFIKGTSINRLILTSERINFGELDNALGKATVKEVEFVSSSYSNPIKLPAMYLAEGEFENIKRVFIRLMRQNVTKPELAEIVKHFSNQLTALDLSGSRTLQPEDLKLLHDCNKLISLSLFGCDGLNSKSNPNSTELIEAIKELVKNTPLEHLILGWDTDGDTAYYGDPKTLIRNEDLSHILSETAKRPVDVTIKTWYPTSQMMDKHS